MPNNTLTVLFQGDSITDCDRNRDGCAPNELSGLGTGYAMMAGTGILADHPGRNPQIINRGISGNRVVDLYARWKPDAIHLRPDLISILIGVNDTWHEFGSGNGVEIDRFRSIYWMLVEWTRRVLPDTQLALCEPFVLPCGVVGEGWRDEIDQRREVVAELASGFHCLHVPFQTMFDEALGEAAPGYWAPDGVHPSPAGHARMASLWRHTIGL